jgi:hypothetical protein
MEIKNELRGRISEYVENIQTLNILMETSLGNVILHYLVQLKWIERDEAKALWQTDVFVWLKG